MTCIFRNEYISSFGNDAELNLEASAIEPFTSNFGTLTDIFRLPQG